MAPDLAVVASSTLLERWEAWVTLERGLGARTIKGYRAELTRLSEFGTPESLTTNQLREYLHIRGGSAATISRRISALASLYLFLIKHEERVDDPTQNLDRPKTRKGLPRPVLDLDSRVKTLSPVYAAAAVFLAETGLRVSEACALAVPPPAPVVLRVLGKGNKERLVPLTPKARRALDLLGGRMPAGPRTLQRRFALAGFTPHQLRHTRATTLVQSGADIAVVSKMLGHASPATTMIYAQFNLEGIAQALERAEGR